VVCILLAGGLGWELMKAGRTTPAQERQNPIVAQGPAAPANPSALHSNAEPQLAPIQIAPERLQQIGVTTAVAQFKDVHDELQAPGNVAVDEERLAYVQTRFPGWIKNVFANATWQYVRKGQRLFTIYSPELVSTEQEYLLAKQNQKSLSSGMHGMATQESGWLLQAAAERLR